MDKLSKNILVTGGAGYIGSHTVHELIKEGYNPIIVDDLSTGHKKSLKTNNFYRCNISEKETIKEIINKHKITMVMHFSSSCYVGESTVNPHKYFENNVKNTISLLEVMLECNVKHFIYSSTASIYGQPVYLPIDEKHPINPCSPYGVTQAMVEDIVNSYEKAYGMKHIYLRYFNAAGTNYENNLGEDHRPETHIIPLLMEVASGKKKYFIIYGDDYDTKDGTCIRDYVHVLDLVSAHIKAVDYLINKNRSRRFNLGYGRGHSVKEIIKKVEEITGKKIPIKITKKRKGDPSILISSNEKAKRVLNWSPKHNTEDIIKSAWEWHKKFPRGYDDVK